MFTDICYAIGDLFLNYFKLIKSLHASPNILLIIIGSVAFLWWMGQMVKFNKQAAESGNLP